MNAFINLFRETTRVNLNFVRRRFHDDYSINQTQLDILIALRLQRRMFYCSLCSMSILGGLNMYLFWDDFSKWIKPKVTEPIISVSQDILANKELQSSTQEVFKKFVCELLLTQETLDTVVQLLCKLIRQDLVLEATNELVLNILKDSQVKAELNKVGGYALTDQHNQELLYDLLKKVMENNELQQVAHQTVLEVIEDHRLQEVSSNALWSVVKRAVIPTWGSSPEKTLPVQEVHINLPVPSDDRILNVKW